MISVVLHNYLELLLVTWSRLTEKWRCAYLLIQFWTVERHIGFCMIEVNTMMILNLFSVIQDAIFLVNLVLWFMKRTVVLCRYVSMRNNCRCSRAPQCLLNLNLSEFFKLTTCFRIPTSNFLRCVYSTNGLGLEKTKVERDGFRYDVWKW